MKTTYIIRSKRNKNRVLNAAPNNKVAFGKYQTSRSFTFESMTVAIMFAMQEHVPDNTYDVEPFDSSNPVIRADDVDTDVEVPTSGVCKTCQTYAQSLDADGRCKTCTDEDAPPVDQTDFADHSNLGNPDDTEPFDDDRAEEYGNDPNNLPDHGDWAEAMADPLLGIPTGGNREEPDQEEYDAENPEPSDLVYEHPTRRTPLDDATGEHGHNTEKEFREDPIDDCTAVDPEAGHPFPDVTENDYQIALQTVARYHLRATWENLNDNLADNEGVDHAEVSTDTVYQATYDWANGSGKAGLIDDLQTAINAVQAAAGHQIPEPVVLPNQIVYTKIRRKAGEYVVLAYDANRSRLPEADYHTGNKLDAEQTAKAMTGGVDSPLPK